MEKLYKSAKTRPGATVECGLDHELLIAKFRLKLKKVGKISIPINIMLLFWKLCHSSFMFYSGFVFFFLII